jgi:hypothetical protein
MTWTDADIATPEQAWSDADIAPKQSKGFLTRTRNALEGIIEPVVTMGTGALGSLAGSVAGVGHEVLTGDFGKGKGERTARAVQEALTYRPRSVEGQENLETLGKALEASKLAGLPVAGPELPMIAQAIRQQLPRARIATEAAKEAKAQAAATTARKSLVDPTVREIVAAGQAEGLKFIPSTIKPGRAVQAAETFAGKSNVESAVSRANQPIIQRMVREDIGLPEGTPLVGRVFDDAAEAAAGPYREAATVGKMTVDDGLKTDIQNLTWAQKYSPEVKAAAKAEAVDDLTRRLQGIKEMTGEETVALIKDYRKKSADMRNRSKMGAADEVSNALAEAYDNGAAALENFLERHAPSDLVPRLRESRQQIAKIRDYERATDLATGAVDLNSPSIVNRATEGKPLSGKMETLAKIAALSRRTVKTPEEIGAQTMASPYAGHSMAAGVLGATGGAIGGIPGAIVGYASAPLATTLAKDLIIKMLLSPKRQSRLLTPPKNAPLREGLGYEPFSPWRDMRGLEESARWLPQIEGAPVVSPAAEQSVPLQPLMSEGVPLPTVPGTVEPGGIRTPVVAALRREPGSVPPEVEAALAKEAQDFVARQSLMESAPGAAGSPGSLPFMGEGPPNPPPRGGGGPGWEQLPAPAVEFPLKPEMPKQFLEAMMDAMQRGDEVAMARIGQEYEAFKRALETQSPHPGRERLYNPVSTALRRQNPFDLGPPR